MTSVTDREIILYTLDIIYINCRPQLSGDLLQGAPTRSWAVRFQPLPATFFKSSVHSTAGHPSLRLPDRGLQSSTVYLNTLV